MTVSDARHLLDSRHFDLCLADMRLPDGKGLKLVRHIVNHCTALPVAVITAYGTIENAVAALKAGTFDYLAKPVLLEQLRSLAKFALNLLPLWVYLDRLKKESIIETLKKTRHNCTAAAGLLGITVSSMRYRMELLGLNDE